MSVFLYIQMSPKPPYKKLNYLPSLLQKMIGPHTYIFFEPHPKKDFLLVFVFISALVFVPIWRIFSSDSIQ